MMKTLLLFVSGWLAGCASPPPASTALGPPGTSARSPAPTPVPAKVRELGITRPRALEAEAEHDAEAPNIALQGAQIWVDSEPAGDVSDVLAQRRLLRLEGVFTVLMARREAWRERHPGQPLPGIANLWCDATTSLLVFKSLFQTAAFAGFPSFRLAVQAPERTGYQHFEARVPGPPRQEGTALADVFVLHLDLTAERRAQLVWRVGSRVEDVIDVREGKLDEQVAEQWRTRGGHRSARDRGFDELVLHVSNELTVGDAVRLLDAAHLTKRDFAAGEQVLRVPAFRVTFSVN